MQARRFPTPLALMIALLLGLASPALAQSAPDLPGHDLSGTWSEASGGQATFERKPDGTYAVTWRDARGNLAQGSATLSGGHLAVSLDGRTGVTTELARATGGPASAAASGSSAYDYRSAANDPYERLGITLDQGAAIAGGGELRRQKPGALSSPLAADAYGTPAMAAATRRTVADAQGNKDGIPDNEGETAGSTSVLSWVSMQPFLDKLRNWVEARRTDRPALDAFVSSREAAWGKPVTQLAPDALPDMGRFRAEKAALLTRFGRTPDDVTEDFVAASGSVDGQAIAPRDIFTQRWKPVGKPNGKIVVVSPGFQETGREFVEQANQLSKLGYDVVLMDHQWSGYTVPAGSPGFVKRAEATVAGWIFGAESKRAILDDAGGIDRGFGVARDVAAVAARAAQDAARDYANVPGHGVVLVGNSMGAGPGVLGALTLNDSGRMQLDGAQMPRGLDAVLEAPFIQMTPSILNKVVSFMAHVPGVNAMQVPSAGLPILSHDDAANAKFANHASSEDVRAQLGSMIAARDDIARIRALVDQGQGPKGKVYVIHGDKDPLADPEGSRWLVERLGDRGKLDLIPANDHVLEESPAEQGHLQDGIRWVDPTGNR